MKHDIQIIKWATDLLIYKGYVLQHAPEIVIATPWSNVMRFSTATENLYLKHTPPLLFLEPKVIQILANQLHANVPTVIAYNDDLHCFLMKDAGTSLRSHLNTEARLDLLSHAIQQYTAIQRSAENHIETFLTLGVPDWRLDKLSFLYDQLISQAAFLKREGLTDKELEILRRLSPKVAEQCKLLSQYPIPETIVQPDFHTNNILTDRSTKKLTFIDWGEIVISHPLFALHNFLYQAALHHGIKEQDKTYQQLQNTCCENWQILTTKQLFLDALALVKKLWPVYAALAHYRLMMSVDLQALKSYYANKPNQLVGCFREYMALT